MAIRTKKGPKWEFLQFVTTAGLEAFFDFAIYFSIAINIASIVVLVNKDFGLSTAGFGASDAQIAMAMSVACILPLLYPLGLLPICTSPPEHAQETSHRSGERKWKTHGLRLLLFSLLAVLFFYPFLSQAIHNWAPSRIGEGSGPAGETLITDEEFDKVQEMCFGTIEQFASWESRLLAATEMAGSLLIYLVMIWHLIMVELDEDTLQRTRKRTETLFQTWLVRALFLLIPAALGGILLYCIFRLRSIQAQMAGWLDGQYAGNEWGFGQIVGIVMFVPVVTDMAFAGWTRRTLIAPGWR